MSDRVLKALSDPLNGEDQLLFARAYREYFPALVAFARKRVGSDAEAADIAQETYLRALKYREGQAQSLGTLKSLLFQIANNLLVDRSRLARRQFWGRHVSLEDEPGLVERQPSQVQQIADEQVLERLARVIERLPRKCQDVFVLHRLHGMTRQAVADRLGVSLKTVEKHLTTATALCRKKVGVEWP